MKDTIQKSIKDFVAQHYGLVVDPVLTRTEEQFGDFACNIALQLAQQLGKNPREVAQTIADGLAIDGVSEVTIAGPGFINIRLSDAGLVKVALQGPTSARAGEQVVIETNNPNPFKAMHIGHAFNAILADTIANLLTIDGAETHRVSYHGDVGAHVGKSMYAILRYVGDDVAKLKDIPAEDRNTFMSKMYAEGSRAYKEDEQAKAEINQLAQQSFTLDDTRYREVYELCKQWSFEEIDTNVSRLGNQPIEKRYLESEADAIGVQTVREHPDVFIESDGAYVFPGEQYGSYDNVFVSSTGRGLYAARDLGLMQLKHRDYQAVHSYIVTAEEQKDYFKGVIKAAELCLPELAGVTVNIPHGTVKLSTGKMSSRQGDVLEIAWLFDRISEAIVERGGAVNEDIVAGALRYQFLKVRIGSDVVFDVNEAVSLQGNSGPYLQYAHARARSILAKSDMAPAQEFEGLEEGERQLIRAIGQYAETLERSCVELMPHHVANYLFELCQSFNRFYEGNRVIGDGREQQRISLVSMYADVLQHGLGVLGIPAPDKM